MEIKHFADFKYKGIIPLVDKSVEVDSSDIYEIVIPNKKVDAIELFDRAFDEVEINGEKQILKSDKFNIQRYVINKEGINHKDIRNFFSIRSYDYSNYRYTFLSQDELKFESSDNDLSK